MSEELDIFLQGVTTVAIAGHVNPDGDSIGSTMGLWNYLKDNYPQIEATVYLEKTQAHFHYIHGIELVLDRCPEEEPDLLILLDISAANRIGVVSKLLETAKKTLCFDHHVTNNDEFTWKFNEPDASSASEVLYSHLDPEKVSKNCAEALYTGIVHDTGSFRFPCTSPLTMRRAAELMEKGINTTEIINKTFYKKDYCQNRALGEVLYGSRLFADGRLVLGTITRKERYALNIKANNLEGIVAQLMNTRGAEVALFVYECHENIFKVSARSESDFDVSRICHLFGGGGHVRASGCVIEGSLEEVLDKLLPPVLESLGAAAEK